jgi:hypothetical protein
MKYKFYLTIKNFYNIIINTELKNLSKIILLEKVGEDYYGNVKDL